MGVREFQGVRIHTPLKRDDGAAGGDTVTHELVFDFRIVWESAR